LNGTNENNVKITTMKIRPLVAFKKVNKKSWDNFIKCWQPTGTKKSIENQFYWNYCCSEFGSKLDKEHPFFWKDKTCTNKGTISELGRLLLYGWYYDDEEFSMQVCQWILNAWTKKPKVFNDGAYKRFVKSIRDDYGYYSQNQNEVKIELLKEFFNDELETYLPEKPKEIKEFEEVIEFLNKIKDNHLKEDKDFYYNRADKLEQYAFYLQEILDNYNIPYQTEDEFSFVIDEEKEGWINDLQKKYDEYENNVKITLANKQIN